jgi:hypothetical protein
MAKSFDIHFDSKGMVQINNIQGVAAEECLALTNPYVDKFGGISETVMLSPEELAVRAQLENEIA